MQKLDIQTTELLEAVAKVSGAVGDAHGRETPRHHLEVFALFDRCRSNFGAIRLLAKNGFGQEAVALGIGSPELLSIGLALLLVLLTVITFLSHNEARHSPQWIGLLLSIAIGGLATSRGRSEGVSLPSRA